MLLISILLVGCFSPEGAKTLDTMGDFAKNFGPTGALVGFGLSIVANVWQKLGSKKKDKTINDHIEDVTDIVKSIQIAKKALPDDALVLMHDKLDKIMPSRAKKIVEAIKSF